MYIICCVGFMGSSHIPVIYTKARVARQHFQVQWLAMVYLASLFSSIVARLVTIPCVKG